MSELMKMVEELNRVFYETESVKEILVDIGETEKGYVVFAELPGVKKEDVDISYEDNVLTITDTRKMEDMNYLINERKNVKFRRSISFDGILEEDIVAKLENGVLRVDIFVKSPKTKVKKNIVIE